MFPLGQGSQSAYPPAVSANGNGGSPAAVPGAFRGLPSNGGFLGKSFSSMIATPMVQASSYVPDASDEIDLELSEYLMALKPEAANKLQLFRKARGSYVIAGRPVSLLRMEDDEEIVVREEGMGDSDLFTPLETYLDQASHIAVFLESKPQSKMQMQTFGDARIPDDADPFTARLMCMRMAVDQAERRQAHNVNLEVRQPTGVKAAAVAISLDRASNVANRAGASAKSKSEDDTQGLDAEYASKKTAKQETSTAEAKANEPPPSRSWWERLTGTGTQSESEESSSGSDNEAK